jgi:hypothetical protein
VTTQIFFKDDVFPILDSVDYDHVIIGGDWNLGMDESLDYYGYANTDPVRPKSRLELHKQIEHYDLQTFTGNSTPPPAVVTKPGGHGIRPEGKQRKRLAWTTSS